MKLKPFSFVVLLLFFFGASWTLADDSQPIPEGNAENASASPTPSPTPKPSKNVQTYGSIKALIVHKPLIPPAWGHVIQYHRQENFVLSDNNRETLHEFVLQDDSGVVRTAIYHENPSGEGYWEVMVWDQP
jgi:hypothetical protein